MGEESGKQPAAGQQGGLHNYVDADRPGSEFDTSEMPAIPEETVADAVAESKKETDGSGLAPDESVQGIIFDSTRPGSNDDTVIARRDEFKPTENLVPKAADPARPGSKDETRAFEPADEATDEAGEDEEPTAMRGGAFDDLETREVPALSEDWKRRATEVAESMGETAQVVDAWGEESDASLAASVAAASGEMPMPGSAERNEVAGPVLEKARAAQAAWARLRFEQRLRYFDDLRNELVTQRNDYVPAMATAIGRPMVETLAGEYLPVLEVLRTLEEVVPPLLVDQHSASPPATHGGIAACVKMAPYGVVLLVNRSQSPFAFPMTLAIDALATGNAVLICGAEQHPRVNETMRKMFRRANLPEDLVQVIGGDVETIRVVVDAGPDKLIFEGDEDVAAKLATRCLASGCEFQPLRRAKDMLVVLANADLERAITAALTGAFASGGLRHGAMERMVVEDAVYDEFRMRFIDAIRTMNSHHAQLATINDGFNPRRAQMLIEDAIARGARVTYPAGETPGRWIHWKASVVEALPPKAKLATERFEGPGCALYRALAPADEALQLLRLVPSNNVSIFGKPGRELRQKLEDLPAARIAFNEALLAGAGSAGGVPLGGDTPRTMCGPRSMLRSKLVVSTEDAGRRIAWFPYTDDKAYALMDAMEAMYGLEAGKRIKAALRLVLNASKRRLLKGEE